MRKLPALTAQKASQCDYRDGRPRGGVAREEGICRMAWATPQIGYWPLMCVCSSFLGRSWRAVCALLALLLSLSVSVNAQGPSPADVPVPVLPGPPPSSQEQLLSPVPPQFDWIQREMRPNPLLETLLTLQDRPPRLSMSATLAEEYSDDFSQGGGNDNGSDEYRTILTLGTVYRLDNGQSFVSLANSISANYRARAEEGDIGFANLSLNVGHQMPRLSLALSENFVRDDDTGLTSSGVRRDRRTFLRNRVSPQARYAFSRLTSMAFAYTNTLVLSEGGADADDEIGHAVATSLQHQFSRVLTGNASYTFKTDNSNGGADTQAHRAAVDFGYLIDRRSSLVLQLFGLITDRSDGGTDSSSYGTSFGLRRQLTSALSAFVAVGATVLDLEAEDPRVYLTWQISLDGVLPLSRYTSLVLTSQQDIDDTAGEVDNIGIVLRQAVTFSLNHRFTQAFLATVFVNFARTEQLEDALGTTESMQNRDDNFWRAGARASYALSRVLALSLEYLYQRRDSTLAGGDFDENRLTLAVSSGWSIF